MAVAYFITWTSYGTWLPGDPRGWILHSKGQQLPDPKLEEQTRSLLTEDPCILDEDQRACVERTIAEHCNYRGWHLHAVSCRTNHLHVVVTATSHAIKTVREQFKAWCTRKLNELERKRGAETRLTYWADRGWDEYVDNDEELFNVIDYVLNRQ